MMTWIRRLAMLALAASALLAVAALIWWMSTRPPEYLAVGPAYVIGDVPEDVVRATAQGDPIGDTLETLAPEIPGYDDVVLQEHLGRAFVTARDGWIWKVDLKTGAAEQYLDVPLIAAGAHEMPGDDNTLCFCAMYLYGEEHDLEERVGLYKADLVTKEITPILQQVPFPPDRSSPANGNQGTVFAGDAEHPWSVVDLNDANSRPLKFCNDFDISEDGLRFYVSEPFDYPGASMGGGAFGEAITLGRNGRLWKIDTGANTVSLVAQNYTFIDGVLLENDAQGKEQSVLVSETVKFRILRLHLAGERVGSDEVLWEFLPGMPDGLERGPAGNIWVGMIKQRSDFVTWAHANPWVKPILLRVPQERLPVPTVTGVLALSPDASEALWYAEHPGTKVHDIAAVNVGETGVYPANFSNETPGLHRFRNPLAQDPAAH